MQTHLTALQTRIHELETQNASERSTYRAMIAKMASTCRSLQSRIDWLESRRLPTEVNPTHNFRRRCTWPIELSRSQRTSSLPISRISSAQCHASSPRTTPSIDTPSFPDPDEWPHLEPEEAPVGILIYDDAALLSKALLWF